MSLGIRLVLVTTAFHLELRQRHVLLSHHGNNNRLIGSIQVAPEDSPTGIVGEGCL